MKYCPKCQAEYHEQIEMCADCQEKLVRDMPAKKADESGSEYQRLEFDNRLVFIALLPSIVLLLIGFWALQMGNDSVMSFCFFAFLIGLFAPVVVYFLPRSISHVHKTKIQKELGGHAVLFYVLALLGFGISIYLYDKAGVNVGLNGLIYRLVGLALVLIAYRVAVFIHKKSKANDGTVHDKRPSE